MIGSGEQRFDLRFRQCRGQPLRALGRSDAQTRVLLCDVLAQGPLIEPLEDRQTPVHAARQTVAPPREVGAERRFAHAVERRVARRSQPLREKTQIAPIGVEGVARETVFEPERVAELIDERGAATVGRAVGIEGERGGLAVVPILPIVPITRIGILGAGRCLLEGFPGLVEGVWPRAEIGVHVVVSVVVDMHWRKCALGQSVTPS